MFMKRTILVALWMSCCALMHARADLPEGGFLDRDKVMKSAAAVTLEVYPNADEVLVDDYVLAEYEADLYTHIESNAPDIFDTLKEKKEIDSALEEKMHATIKAFTETFKASKGIQ